MRPEIDRNIAEAGLLLTICIIGFVTAVGFALFHFWIEILTLTILLGAMGAFVYVFYRIPDVIVWFWNKFIANEKDYYDEL